jgi:histidinol-phosphate aminotransferase
MDTLSPASDILSPSPRNAIETIQVYRHGRQVHGTVRLSSNENTFGPSQKVSEAVLKNMDGIHLYPDPNCSDLRKALGALYQIQSEQMVFGNGSDEILMFAAAAFLEKGDAILTSEETFPQYEFVGKVFEAEIHKLPLHDFSYDLKAIAAKITSKTKIIFLCNPNNPTGTYFSHSQLEVFLGKVPPTCLVVLDEAYSEFAEAADFPNSLSLLNSFENLLILRTFSKAFGLAGLRIGYGISSAKVIHAMSKVKFPFNVNRLAQIAAIAALDDRDYLEKTKRSVAAGKQYLTAALAKYPIRILATQTNFLYLILGQWDPDIEDKLERYGVTVKSFLNRRGFTALRVTIGDATQNEKFISALSQYLRDMNLPLETDGNLIEAPMEALV